MGQAENNLGTYLKLILLKCGLDHFVDLQWTIYFLYKIKVLNMSCVFIYFVGLCSKDTGGILVTQQLDKYSSRFVFKCVKYRSEK